MKNSGAEIVDFHSHTLPCIDHGSLSLKTSIAQLGLASEHGVSRVLATPHFYPHAHNLFDFIEKRKRSVEMLFDAKDNFSTELTTYIYITYGNYQKVLVKNNEFKFEEAGEYVVKHSAVDEMGNTSVVTYTIVCK